MLYIYSNKLSVSKTSIINTIVDFFNLRLQSSYHKRHAFLVRTASPLSQLHGYKFTSEIIRDAADDREWFLPNCTEHDYPIALHD
jgi:hypothetical protein